MSTPSLPPPPFQRSKVKGRRVRGGFPRFLKGSGYYTDWIKGLLSAKREREQARNKERKNERKGKVWRKGEKGELGRRWLREAVELERVGAKKKVVLSLRQEEGGKGMRFVSARVCVCARL